MGFIVVYSGMNNGSYKWLIVGNGHEGWSNLGEKTGYSDLRVINGIFIWDLEWFIVGVMSRNTNGMVLHGDFSSG